jgi:hypothetical protein
MTTLTKWLNNLYLIAVLLAAGVTTDVILIGLACDLSKSDWGTWVGSVGTVLTLVGTIWLATAAERKRRREQLDLAIIAAASLSSWISDLRQAIWVAQQNMPGTLGAPDDAQLALADCIKSIDHVGIWSRDDLAPLVVLPGHTAARLASLGVQIRIALASLKQASGKPELDMEDLVGIHAVLGTYFDGFSEVLEPIQAECQTFLQRHGFGQIHDPMLHSSAS